ncbi:hypothetical protein D9758_004205 [Tetrapyrgos nigripes]|uniref:NADH dehydrogenase [ubiquinone] 1 alpha subcomplex assembly factor 3 n=1 Tax=Tetrapyrgos nigripes TaxID=182062 RepID=A0A8H5LVY5_9AGAR|nr:hypothetical protein D9758_004205 [Tetrapyrgos nigripes]
MLSLQHLLKTSRSLAIHHHTTRNLVLAAKPALSTRSRSLHSSRAVRREDPFVNILADETPPPVQVSSITNGGIQLADGLILPSSCIFLEGKVFLWDVPTTLWKDWTKDHFEVFEVVVPKPEILLLGTGKLISQPPPFIREHLNQMGIQLDVMDTRNACSTYNLLSEEGRRVAAALLPLRPTSWQKASTTGPK